MIKKMYALFISVILLFALCPGETFAEGTPTLADQALVFDETGGVTTEGSLLDDFNDLIPDESAAYSNLFSTLEGRNFNKIFQATTPASEHNLYKIVSDTGANGQQSSMLEIACNASNHFALPGKHPLSNGQIARFYYDVNFKEWKDSDPDDSAVPNLELAYGNACGMSVIGSDAGAGDAYFNKNKATPAVTYPMELDKWYTVVSEISYGGENRWKMKTLILDSVTGKVLFSGNEGTNYEAKIGISIVATSAVGDVKFRMDNVGFEAYTPANFAPVMKKCSVQEGATNVPLGEAISVSFDQPIQTMAATLTPANGGTAVSCTMVQDTKYINTYTVSWNGYLEEETSYTLDLSGCQNSGGQALSGTSTVSFTTGSLPIQETVLRDSFEDTTFFTVSDGSGYYDRYKTTKPFVCSSADIVGCAFLSSTGYTGNAVEIRYKDDATTASRASFYSASAYSVGENDALVLDYRMKISNASVSQNEDGTFAGGNKMSIGLSKSASATPLASTTVAVIDLDAWTGQHYIGKYANENGGETTKGRKGFYYDPATWYNARLVVTKSDLFFSLIDAATGEILWENELAKDLTGTSFYLTPVSLVKRDNGENYAGASMTIDDIGLWKVKTDRVTHKLQTLQTPTAAGDGAVTLNFNQPTMAKPSMLTLYKGTDTNTPVDFLPNVKYNDFCTNVVTFPGLELGETYTLDYSGVISSGGVGFAETELATQLITFKVDDPTETAVTAISCSGTKPGDTISLNFWATESATPSFVAAFYDGENDKQLVGVEIVKQPVSVGKNPITITLTKDVSQANAASVYVWNNLSELKPITGAVPLTCGDTKKILLIGNSLSEDTQRYLNNVAQLGGADLDVTASIIGGSTLANHRANLEAEIGGRTVEQAQQEQAGTEENLRLLYTIYKNSNVQTGKHRLLDALQDEQYDVISIQPYSHAAFYAQYYDEETFAGDFLYLAKQIRALQPKAEIVLYQIWPPYVSEVTGQRSLYFNSLIKPATKQLAALAPNRVAGLTTNNRPMTIIPVGRAFNIADENYAYFGSAPGTSVSTEADFARATGLWRDSDHASYYGCYLADVVWYEMLTGRKAETGTEQNPAVPAPDGITSSEHFERLRLLSDIGHTAVLEEKVNYSAD